LRLAVLTLLITGFCLRCVQAAPVTHPNLLLNRDEIEQVKAKIAKYPWAAAGLEKTKEQALKESSYLNAALYYVFTGEKTFADRARGYLLGHVNEKTFGAWGISWGAVAWTYDVVYDTCSEAERVQIERWLKAACTALIDEDRHATTTPNLIFGKHLNVALVGYYLGDKEVIDWGLNNSGEPYGPQKGGFYPVMDTMIRDGHFWAEAPIYALVYDVHSMLALAEAAPAFSMPMATGASGASTAISPMAFPGWRGWYRNACEFVWVGKDGVTVSSNGMRLFYRFEEDRIIYRVIQPTDPAKSWTAWLGTFDIIGDPIHRKKAAAANGAGAGERYFLPHSVFQQGLLVTLPSKTELTYPKCYGYGVSFPLRPGQDIVLQFMTKAEWEALSHP